jgi:hypothetical protein
MNSFGILVAAAAKDSEIAYAANADGVWLIPNVINS